MKKMLLISGALLAVMATSAMANGLLGLHIGDCTGVSVINNNCATNAGIITLCSSVTPTAAVPQFVAMEFVLDIGQAGAGPLSSWWDIGTPGCRNGAMSSAADFSFVPDPNTGVFQYVACSDPWGRIAASGGSSIVLPSGGTVPNPAASARITGVYAIGAPNPLAASTEYYGFFIKISKAGQLTTPCTGCATPTNIVLNNIRLIQPAGVGDFDYSGDGTARQQCSYNGGNQPTEAKKTSWGSIKALYR
jgi:hypothetical protein